MDAGKRQVRHHPPHGLCAGADHYQRLRRARCNRGERGPAHQRLTVDDEELLGLSEPTGFARGEQNLKLAQAYLDRMTVGVGDGFSPKEVDEARLKVDVAASQLAELKLPREDVMEKQVTVLREQIEAACGEAKALGLRTLVHAHSSDGARAAILAGCTAIEHGTFLDDATLELMGQKGTYFDPNFLVLHNYLDNKPKFLGIGNYNEEGFAAMARALPLVADVLKVAGIDTIIPLYPDVDTAFSALKAGAE